MSAHITRRVWVQNVAVGETVLRSRLDALKARRSDDPDPEADAIDAGVRSLLDKASNAAYRIDPRPHRFANWFRGSLLEAAFQNLHAAEAEIALLYDADELRAELPEALARVEESLQKDDPRRADAQRVATSTEPPDARAVSKIIEVGYSASDQSHTRVRSFRNVVVLAALVITLFLVVFTVYISKDPTAVPLCFRQAVTQTTATTASVTPPPVGAIQVICPTSESILGQGGGPQGRDVLVVGLVGLMGGALAAAISLRNVRGTSTPYNVPVCLAILKLPTGALTAIAALIAIRGDFVPGLSALDSQEQILAYALAFGYAQQLLTGLVDRQGQTILSGVPSKDAAGQRPSTALTSGLPATSKTAPGSVAGSDEATDDDTIDDDALFSSVPADAIDDSDTPDPVPRDVDDPTVVDESSNTVEDLPDDDDDDGSGDVDAHAVIAASQPDGSAKPAAPVTLPSTITVDDPSPVAGGPA